MRLVWAVLAALALVIGGLMVWRSERTTPDTLERLIAELPAEVAGWRAVGDDLVVPPGSLADVLGEREQPYAGARRALLRRWVRDLGGPQAELRVVLMADAAAARAAMHGEAFGESFALGDEAVRGRGGVTLRVGPFVAIVDAPPEVEPAAVTALARAVARAAEAAAVER